MDDITEKLDQIIGQLQRIEKILGLPVIQPSVTPPVTTRKPTKAMLEFERRIKFFAKMDRKYFLAEIRRSAEKIAEIREIYPGWMVNFDPKFIASIDERMNKTGAEFYKDLRVWADGYVSAAQAAAVKLLPQA